MGTYSIFYLMHSPLILIFISVSIFFFTLLGCVFSQPSLPHPLPVLSQLCLLMSWIPVWVGFVRPHRLFGSLALWMWLVSAIKWTNEGYKTIRLGFLSFPFVSFLHVAPVRFLWVSSGLFWVSSWISFFFA